MEEGLYEVDVKSLAVTGLIKDCNPSKKDFSKETHPATIDSQLPGYHGKGLYSSQDRVVYANNGDRDKRVLTDPTTPSGALWLHEAVQAGDISEPFLIAGWKHPGVWFINHGKTEAGFDGDLGKVTVPAGQSRRFDIAVESEWLRLKAVCAASDVSVIITLSDGDTRGLTQDAMFDQLATERDMLSTCGTFFELPAENADGFAKIRPIASHDLHIMDCGSYRGLLLMSGVKPDAKGEHIIRSDDGKAALRVGAIDDLWKLGKPRGQGGPWKNTKVQAGQASDPYLMWGYDQRMLDLTHDGRESVTFRIEVDLTGTGEWVTYLESAVAAGQTLTLEFAPAIQARWLRITAAEGCTATAQLQYR